MAIDSAFVMFYHLRRVIDYLRVMRVLLCSRAMTRAEPQGRQQTLAY